MATVDSLRTDYDRGRNIFRRPSVKILLDEIGRLNGQVLYWKAATEAARDDIKLLSVANEQMADAWMRTETIQPDGNLRPSRWEIDVWKERSKTAEQALHGVNDPEFLTYCSNAWDNEMGAMDYIDWLNAKNETLQDQLESLEVYVRQIAEAVGCEPEKILEAIALGKTQRIKWLSRK